MGLTKGDLPVDEPGLADLVRRELAAGSLRFTSDREKAARGAELVWIAYDTPVDADDRADVAFVVERARALVQQRPERRDPRLVAASRRYDAAARAVEPTGTHLRVLA